MRHRAALILTLIAWLLATGAHWDVLQSVAWGRMFVRNAATMPLADALRLTFAPGSSCSLCAVVSEARQQRTATEAPAPEPERKITLDVGPAVAGVTPPPAPAPRHPQDATVGESRRARPAVPPPRQLLG